MRTSSPLTSQNIWNTKQTDRSWGLQSLWYISPWRRFKHLVSLTLHFRPFSVDEVVLFWLRVLSLDIFDNEEVCGNGIRDDTSGRDEVIEEVRNFLLSVLPAAVFIANVV